MEMRISESVVLPLPEHVHARREAAARFTEQCEVIATIEIRGQVLLEDTTTRLFPDWVIVSQLDDILNLLGLGDWTELPEDARLLWARPLQSEFRLQEMREEH
ncbi:hypothetical protein [Ktedonospora formicarum]|uniref:Uncharacterized protein n=1 Tax=Ktedonospora formicarum TaxID=2778364 RepID=A0A8J3I2D0_9CHLR|nr:hypothetical protein [Ktedonospora formicarum]GHO47496.1 hypothetical protein KSX_56590 [Ktedonospora formicarum]